MRDQNDGLAAGALVCTRRLSARFAGIVEVGVGLVEHHQRRIAVDGAGQRRCAGAGRPTAGRRRRRSACRSPAAGAGSSRAGRRAAPRRSPAANRARAKRAMFSAMRAFEQLDVLRQVAELRRRAPSRFRRQRPAVEQHVAAGIRARCRAITRASVDLPEPDGAEHHRHRAGGEAQVDAREDRRVSRSGALAHDAAQLERACGASVGRLAAARRIARAAAARAGARRRARSRSPRHCADQRVDRRQRPGHQHVGGDHRAGRSAGRRSPAGRRARAPATAARSGRTCSARSRVAAGALRGEPAASTAWWRACQRRRRLSTMPIDSSTSALRSLPCRYAVGLGRRAAGAAARRHGARWPNQASTDLHARRRRCAITAQQRMQEEEHGDVDRRPGRVEEARRAPWPVRNWRTCEQVAEARAGAAAGRAPSAASKLALKTRACASARRAARRRAPARASASTRCTAIMPNRNRRSATRPPASARCG